MRTAVIVIVLLGILAASVGVSVWAWQAMGEAEISWHGVVALWLGAALTFMVGAGLMALLFFSRRHGYDERAYRPDGPAQPPSDEH